MRPWSADTGARPGRSATLATAYPFTMSATPSWRHLGFQADGTGQRRRGPIGLRMGGSISAEHGIGVLSATNCLTSGQVAIELMRAIRRCSTRLAS